MATVHTDGPAIFNSFPINEAEADIKYIKVDPTISSNSNSAITFEIPGKSSKYTDLRHSYLHIKIHLEETDQFGKPLPGQNAKYVSIESQPFDLHSIVDKGISERQKSRHKRNLPYDSSGPEHPLANKSRKKRNTNEESQPSSSSNDQEQSQTSSDIPELDDLENMTYEKMLSLRERGFKAFLKALQDQEKATKARQEGSSDADHLELIAQGEMIVAEELMKALYISKLHYLQNSNLPRVIVPLDNILHSMWSDIEIHMNNTKVNDSNRLYMYKSFIETLLNNSNATKIFQLQSQGYYGDTGNKDYLYTYTLNNGMEKRHQKFKNNRVNELSGFLLDDVMGVSAAIVNAVRTVIKLIPNYENIRLQTFGENVYGKIVIDDIWLMVCQRKMSDEVLLAHNEIMEKKPASYPFKKAEMGVFHAKKGDHSIKISNPYESKIPTRLIVGMVNADAYSGDFARNPLRFQHYNVKKAAFYIDNESASKPPYELSPEQGIFLEPYRELYSILGKAGEDMDIGLTPEDYVNGSFLLPFDIVPTAAGNLEYIARKNGGTCSLELSFSKPLPEDIYVITYGVFPYLLEIDAARNVFAHPL